MQEPETFGRCGAWTLVAENEGERRAFPLRCRSWTCPRCGPAMRRRLTRLITDAQPNALLTLTCRPSLHRSPEAAFDAMATAFPLLLKRIRRHAAPAPVNWLSVWELTRAGWPHLHIVLRAPYVPQRLISAWWSELTGAPIVDIRAIDNPRIASRYVAKYLTKAPVVGLKRRLWRSSPAFLPEPFRPKPDRPTTWGKWSVRTEALHDVLLDWWRDGWDPALTATGEARAAPSVLLRREGFHVAAWSRAGVPPPADWPEAPT